MELIIHHVLRGVSEMFKVVLKNASVSVNSDGISSRSETSSVDDDIVY